MLRRRIADALAALPVTDAVRLTNWFPASLGEVVTRGGSFPVAWNIGPASPAPAVRSLWQYGPQLGSPDLFAVTDTGIYNISAGGDQLHAVPAANATLTNGYWNATQVVNSFGQPFLWGCNGVDQPRVYNGSAWAVPTITGPNPLNLIFPFIFKRRLWCVEKNSMTLWYGDVDSFQGEFKPFPVGALFSQGGYLVAAADWTIDGGDGPDDYLVMISSEGEIAIYQGTDPASMTSFSLIGVFYIGAPLGRRCFTKYGGDLIILTEQGAFPLSQAMKDATVDYRMAVSSKIQPTFINNANQYRVNLGWEGTFFPNKNAFIVNVPIVAANSNTPVRSVQLVMNTLTAAWCDFEGWNANCFTLFEHELYFGVEGGAVWKAWSTGATNDNNLPIIASGQTAFNYLGRSPSIKTVDLVRPLLSYDEKFDLAWGLAVDFQLPARLSGFASRDLILGESYWDTAVWDVAAWSIELSRLKLWRAPQCRPGYAFSLALRTITDIGTVSWSGHDFLVNRGGQI